MSNWEKVDDNTKRLEVPGGWIYRMKDWPSQTSESSVFVPTPVSVYSERLPANPRRYGWRMGE